MDAYMFQAALYCPRCACAIKKKLTAPENPDDTSSYDSDEYPKGPFPDGGGMSDLPEHCDACRRPLHNPLTSDGIEYVIEAIKKHLLDPGDGEFVWNRPQDSGTWYEGRKHWHVVADWTRMLDTAILYPSQQEIVDVMNDWLDMKELDSSWEEPKEQ